MTHNLTCLARYQRFVTVWVGAAERDCRSPPGGGRPIPLGPYGAVTFTKSSARVQARAGGASELLALSRGHKRSYAAKNASLSTLTAHISGAFGSPVGWRPQEFSLQIEDIAGRHRTAERPLTAETRVRIPVAVSHKGPATGSVFLPSHRLSGPQRAVCFALTPHAWRRAVLRRWRTSVCGVATGVTCSAAIAGRPAAERVHADRRLFRNRA